MADIESYTRDQLVDLLEWATRANLSIGPGFPVGVGKLGFNARVAVSRSDIYNSVNGPTFFDALVNAKDDSDERPYGPR